MDGNAIVWCEGAFLNPNGKTAHGLVRHTRRYRVTSVVDSAAAGRDAGLALDGRERGVPIVASLADARAHAATIGAPASHLVVGIAPDGGRMDGSLRGGILAAIDAGLHVDCGLHDFMNDDAEISSAAAQAGVTLRDVRRTPPRAELHGFTGRIAGVRAHVVALLGTDSAVGKRTTAWMLVDALRAAGATAELVGTGQTAWLQGARWGILLDALINDFVAGELEHAVVSCWEEARPDYIVVEGQGSLLNPAYPGGFEILAAARPRSVVLQHAPARVEYDGFPGFRMHPVERQIEALELVSERPVVAITVNQEGLADRAAVEAVCADLSSRTGRPAVAPLEHGLGRVVDALKQRAG
jgi:uncharacterized NAD-dependent epimerase/dehydratase family protein